MVTLKIKRKTARRIGAGIVALGIVLAIGWVPAIVLGIGLAVLYVTR